MTLKWIRTGIVCCVAAGLLLIGWSAVRSQRQAPVKPSMSVLQSRQKPKAPVREMPSSAMPELTAADVNKSMKARRNHAWATLKRAWEPVQIQGGQIPTWMTWYEQEDIQVLYKEMLAQPQNQPQPPSREEVKNQVAALLVKHSTKDLQTSLTSKRLGRTLRQFTFPAFHAIAPNAKPKAGTIYYNPAYVKHLLANAESIAKCNPSAPPRPADRNNLYAQCMDHEMPSDAVMIKTQWSPVALEPSGYGYVNEHMFDLRPTMAAKLLSPPAGQWIEFPWSGNDQASGGTQAVGFWITDENGKLWQLQGMHIASKDLRTWMWTSIMLSGGKWNWGTDMPQVLLQDWSLSQYGMCTVSDFNEGDPAPWSAYDKGAACEFQSVQCLADALKAVAGVMNGRQWCANPYIEPDMARGNCIGCHQGSPYSFLPTTLTKDRQTNAADFGFSFDTNRANIIQIRNEYLLKEKIKPKP